MELNKIYQGNCIELMQFIDDKSIDMILCDLPYGTTACKWDTIIPFEPLWVQYYRVLRPNGFIVLMGSQPFTTKLISSNINNFSHQWIWEKEQGSNPLLANVTPMKNFEDIIVFINEYSKHDVENGHPQRNYFKKVMNFIGLNLKQINSKLGHRRAEHTFYIDSTQYGLCTEPTYNELIKTFGIDEMDGFIDWNVLNFENIEFRKKLITEYDEKFPRTYNPQKTKGKKYKSGGGYIEHLDQEVNGGNESEERYPTSIIKFNTDKNKSQHPTQKPVALFEYLIKTYTNEGDLVLDNCIGSGTTAIACLQTNRNFIGMELEPKYVDIANKRIADFTKQECLI